jgi:GH24 family phage-related lysozyme (muramidase)
MHPEVAAAWRAFTEPLEGYVTSMYCDVKGLITTGCGNLIDPEPAALQLPWKHANGELATVGEISAAWRALKAQRDKYAKLHWKYAAQLNDLRLSDRDIDVLVLNKLNSNVAYLRRTFSRWDTFPADGQLGILSMAWAVGPGFTKAFGNFTRLVLEGDWGGTIAKDASGGYAAKIREAGNPGIVPRNARNRLCFANAELVARGAFDVDRLNWPNVVPPTPSATVNKSAADAMLEAKQHNDEAMDRFVREEIERVRQGLSSGAALRAYEETDT